MAKPPAARPIAKKRTVRRRPRRVFTPPSRAPRRPILASLSVGWATIDLVQRIALVLLAVACVASVAFAVASARGTSTELSIATASGPLLGITGSVPRFKGETGQASSVDQAFLGWDQGRSYGSRFAVLFRTHGPIPMIHLGTKGRGKTEAITPGGIASGQGDAYLIALNEAIAFWGKGIYVRPLAEMNSASALWSGYLANGQPRDA